MPTADLDWATLIAPVDEDLFWREHWEKQSLHVVRGKPDYYAGLLSTADVDQVIAFTRPKFADPGAFRDEPTAAKTYVQGWLADRPLDDEVAYPGVEDLRRVYSQGKTVVVMTMQQRWLPVARLCRNLEAAFHCPVHANMYLTPKGAQGFDAHFDTHEVLVLQLEGSKHWRLYDSARKLPLTDERFHVRKSELGAPRDVILEAGDLLYIPRGHVHEAFTSERQSLHLTVGVNVYRWADLLQEALDQMARRDDRLRESIPPGVLCGQDAASALKGRALELLANLAQSAPTADAVRGLGGRFLGKLQVLPDSQFITVEAVEAVGPDTVLEKSRGALCRVTEDAEWAAIEFPGGQVGGPPKIASALRFVARSDRFAVRALPDDLGPEAKLVLVRRLLREGLLKVAARDRTEPPARDEK